MDMGFLGGLPAKLATIITNIGTLLTRVSANVDVNVSTRAAASSALINTTWTDAKAGYLDMAISGVARIKSIQYGTVALVGQTATATITSVTTSKAVLIPLGASNTASTTQTPDMTEWRITLTNSTTITATRGSNNGSAGLTIGFVVMEFY